jgi:chromosomal replication initiation ATPase DnaA
MKDPIRESYHRTALGSTTFIEKVKEKIDQEGRRREIPSTRILSEYTTDTVISKMTQVLYIKKNIIFDKKRGNLYRPLAIYLIKRFTPCSLYEIGKIFQMDYSAVSQAAKRFEQKCEVNQEIKEVMQKVITALKEG